VWTGFQIGRLAAESTDTSWNPCFVHDQKVLFKLCRCDYRASAAARDAPQPARPATRTPLPLDTCIPLPLRFSAHLCNLSCSIPLPLARFLVSVRFVMWTCGVGCASRRTAWKA
jgi:hypothetical protein